MQGPMNDAPAWMRHPAALFLYGAAIATTISMAIAEARQRPAPPDKGDELAACYSYSREYQRELDDCRSVKRDADLELDQCRSDRSRCRSELDDCEPSRR